MEYKHVHHSWKTQSIPIAHGVKVSVPKGRDPILTGYRPVQAHDMAVATPTDVGENLLMPELHNRHIVITAPSVAGCGNYRVNCVIGHSDSRVEPPGGVQQNCCQGPAAQPHARILGYRPPLQTQLTTGLEAHHTPTPPDSSRYVPILAVVPRQCTCTLVLATQQVRARATPQPRVHSCSSLELVASARNYQTLMFVQNTDSCDVIANL
ncbi:hypothetical protein J6590_000411 [Homalodisca vitripennis]|nr:hypothetical protein J6590_104348 [Homalodisca vitripennis]KAG8338732.1 hypothetical protein J6590_000411 [Homalodisca vitripennis]